GRGVDQPAADRALLDDLDVGVDPAEIRQVEVEARDVGDAAGLLELPLLLELRLHRPQVDADLLLLQLEHDPVEDLVPVPVEVLRPQAPGDRRQLRRVEHHPGEHGALGLLALRQGLRWAESVEHRGRSERPLFSRTGRGPGKRCRPAEAESSDLFRSEAAYASPSSSRLWAVSSRSAREPSSSGDEIASTRSTARPGSAGKRLRSWRSKSSRIPCSWPCSIPFARPRASTFSSQVIGLIATSGPLRAASSAVSSSAAPPSNSRYVATQLNSRNLSKSFKCRAPAIRSKQARRRRCRSPSSGRILAAKAQASGSGLPRYAPAGARDRPKLRYAKRQTSRSAETSRWIATLGPAGAPCR